MEEAKQSEKSINLVQKSGTYNYKLVIPTEVEKKIRFTCQKIWNTEWSGILFFTHEGSFENNDLVIRCVDIYIMDIGTQIYTEFDMNPDVIAYMTDNPELLNCQTGLLHSHHSMKTTFSGTDINTLKEEGKDRNNFVSLIVNNEGTYTAAITRKVKSKYIKESISYEFFGDGEKHDTKEYVNTEEIECFYLKIEKENEDCSFSDIASRLEEIRKSKEEKTKKSNIPVYRDNCGLFIANSHNINKDSSDSIKNDFNQKTFFDDEDDISFKENYDIPYEQVTFDKDTIKSLVLQLVTSSIIISNNSKINIEKWVKSMPSLYEKRFGKGKEGMDNFKSWAETYIEYLVCYTTDSNLEELGFSETEIYAICAYNMIEELNKLPDNEYIQEYIDILQKYLVL